MGDGWTAAPAALIERWGGLEAEGLRRRQARADRRADGRNFCPGSFT